MNEYPLYMKAFNNRLSTIDLDKIDDKFKQTIFLGVKTINTCPNEYSSEMFDIILTITLLMERITPREFMNIFPVKKDFDGYKYEIKDYYSTMEYVNEMNWNNPIGGSITELLWEYMNKDIHQFKSIEFSCLNKLRKQQGNLDIMEEFMASEGYSTPNTFKDNRGNTLYVRDGKPQQINKNTKLELIK